MATNSLQLEGAFRNINVGSDLQSHDIDIKIDVNFNANIQNENDIYSINSFRMCENPFAFKGNGRIMSKDYKLKIKTELCKSWIKTKNCPYGNTCAFAHGEHELQKKKHVPSKYKTKLCQ